MLAKQTVEVGLRSSRVVGHARQRRLGHLLLLLKVPAPQQIVAHHCLSRTLRLFLVLILLCEPHAVIQVRRICLNQSRYLLRTVALVVRHYFGGGAIATGDVRGRSCLRQGAHFDFEPLLPESLLFLETHAIFYNFFEAEARREDACLHLAVRQILDAFEMESEGACLHRLVLEESALGEAVRSLGALVS